MKINYTRLVTIAMLFVIVQLLVVACGCNQTPTAPTPGLPSPTQLGVCRSGCTINGYTEAQVNECMTACLGQTYPLNTPPTRTEPPSAPTTGGTTIHNFMASHSNQECANYLTPSGGGQYYTVAEIKSVLDTVSESEIHTDLPQARLWAVVQLMGTSDKAYYTAVFVQLVQDGYLEHAIYALD